ncbi:MAG: hypothetical protein UX80_C0001G0017 [Candidatus Amesbacteria bacterium GW2011_GWA2_47_11b]|uniref:DUF2268 domain-containing protein n=3 Tax=Candidatus Amesiibacteriota TaxID=1752730 RepID=A0A0G1SKZ4_9BACT|nr:MAG: hypothetical protein UX80_C0001G0017 [Candidatus Amesbacteria bacterium GW2011_GWA2_47_11b]KKU70149.1 MAG: hypothetical protein UX92_C0004G0026 [Candidatus Amesbacteria bacterium GW2011_GWA1_47_20]KKU84670.1 MAG: hypothetical protein UY11_C0005G0044 [Candidatus Amesbacteria bacterium GW2011_GWC2_47_8]
MSENIHIQEPSVDLEAFRNQIQAAYLESMKLARPRLHLGEVEVVVVNNPRVVIPEMGMVGRTIDSKNVVVSLDPHHPNLSTTLETDLLKTLLHEYHHCARQAALGFPQTLLDALISEGLADNFQIEITGGKPPRWAVALTEAELTQATKMAEMEYSNPGYDHKGWFFGSKDQGIPRWAGYSLGFKIVSDYLRAHHQESSSSLHALPSGEFVL